MALLLTFFFTSSLESSMHKNLLIAKCLPAVIELDMNF